MIEPGSLAAFSANANDRAKDLSAQASVTAVGRPAATSAAKLGPERIAAGWPGAASARTCVMNRSEPRSMPFAQATSGVSRGSDAGQLRSDKAGRLGWNDDQRRLAPIERGDVGADDDVGGERRARQPRALAGSARARASPRRRAPITPPAGRRSRPHWPGLCPRRPRPRRRSSKSASRPPSPARREKGVSRSEVG